MVESSQLTSDITTPMLEKIYLKKKNYVNSTWTSSLIKELQQYTIQIKLQSTFRISKQWLNDSNIMENKLSSKDKHTKALQ